MALSSTLQQSPTEEIQLRYRTLGKSGLRVSEIALGTMTFGEDWNWGASRTESKKIFDAYTRTGGNFIDTASNYTNGTSEKIVGELIAGDRDRYVVATKYSLSSKKDDPNAGGNHRKNMTRSLRASLERLGTDYVDILWLHMWDYTTPIEEVMKAIDDLARSGKILYAGVSDTPAWVISRANAIAELQGWTPFIGLQVPYSVIGRDPERDLLPMAHTLGLGVTAWAPLGAGLLTGKYTRQTGSEGRLLRPDWGISERGKKIAMVVDEVADQTGHTSAQVALNWVRQKPGMITPIVGATKLSQMTDNLQCVSFQLSKEQMSRLDEASKIQLGFPHDFLQDQEIRELIFGNTFPRIDSPKRT